MAVAGLRVGGVFEGRFEILAELGSGSFGRVFTARQQSTGQLIALKVLRHPEGLDEASARNRIQRFRREARLCAELWHPNVVKLIDSGETAEGVLYVALELVPGDTLRDVLRAEGKLELGEAVHLMAQVLDALSCAHAKGIVHRDLKPENIMITRTGGRRNAVVLDFGLGGFSSEDDVRATQRLTATRELLGTPSYAAPEQLRGERCDARSDLYSWGLVFLECVTGTPPIQGGSAHEVILQQLGPDPIPIPRWLQDQPLGRLLELATAKRAENREVTVDALLSALTRFGVQDAGSTRAVRTVQPLSRERRQLTVVCLRLEIHSVTGAGPADVEEVDAILGDLHRELGERAANAGGVLAAITGGRVFFAFGYPQAREDDGRRATRLALSCIDASTREQGGLRVEARAGLHTGLVIVREPRADAILASQELTGPTPEIAHRLAERARSGEVLVSLDTHRLLRNEFQSESRGECVVSELSQPLQTFAVSAIVRPASEMDSQVWTRETRLVGRRAQLEQLRAGWAEACRRKGGAVLVTGEAGIGKSRLLRELKRSGVQTWIDWHCAPESRTTPLRPVIDGLRSMAPSLEALLLRLGMDVSETLPLLNALLSLPADPRFPELRLSAELRKELTLRALVELVFKLTRDEPAVLAVENLHWSDPTTLELCTSLVHELRSARDIESEPGPQLFVVFTTRPEVIPHWPVEEVTPLPLQRLTQEEMEEMVLATVGHAPLLSDALTAEVLRRAEGVPLFVEELARVMHDRVAADPDAATSPKVPLEIRMPASLRDLLTARLDGVSAAARETAQLAAVLGREFHFDILQAVSSKEPSFLRADIDELGRAGLILRRRSGRGESAVFRHALLRDAAYEAMTRPARQAHHRKAARILRERFPDLVEQRPEILAHHCENGGELGLAADYWLRAGEESYRRAAYPESKDQYEHALTLLRSLEPTPDNRRREFMLLSALGTTLLSMRGWAVPEVEATFADAWELSSDAEGGPPLDVIYGAWGVRVTRSDRAGVEAMLPKFQELAARVDDPMSAHLGNSCLGIAAFWRGDFPAAHDHLQQALRFYGEEHERSAYDGGLYTHAFEFCTLWTLGLADRAKALIDEAFAIADRRRDPYSRCLVLAFAAMVAHDRGDVGLARERAEALMALAVDQRLFAWWAPGAVMYGRTLTAEGRNDEAAKFIRQGLERYKLLGIMCSYNYYLSYLAEAHLAAGKPDEAIAAVDEGLGLCQTLLARFHEPELHRLRGRALLHQGDPAGAEASFRRAIDVAERDGALVYVARGAVDLGRLLAERGQRREATALLAPIDARFTEGLDTADPAGARALLAELG